MSLASKLNRMKSHLIREGATDHKTITPVIPEIPYQQEWARLQARPHVVDDDYIIVREVRYPLNWRHGLYTLEQLREVTAVWEEQRINHPLAAESAHHLLFFDTETTGLHGGTGNTIFLLGISKLEEDSVVVRQYFLPAPHAEVTLYQLFLADIGSSTHLVTYNGKTFDWPQVKTRHTLLRDQVAPLPAFTHYDLLHGARRLWKDELPSCRLAVIEQEKLGIKRHHDVPGHLAPLLYVDYLQTKHPETIEGVLRHNEQDVLTLITLYIHLSLLLLGSDKTNRSLSEQLAIARWYEALGEDDLALDYYRKIANSTERIRGQALLAMGHLHKKRKAYQKALAAWEACINQRLTTSTDVYIEVAKIYEHQLKDFEKALHFTKTGYALWQQQRSWLRAYAKTEAAAFQKRIERLEKRLGMWVIPSEMSDWRW